MSTETLIRRDSTTRRRVGFVALALSITALLALPGGLLWPEASGGGETYTYADIQPQRALWWGLLTALAINLVINVPAQALLTVLLVRNRGAGWATAGGVVLWIGTALYAVGGAGWAAAYYFATADGVDPSVLDRINADSAHIFGVMIPGALLVALGTVLQVVGLWRSNAVPRWIPLLWLTVVATFLVPGNGLIGLLTAVPMTAASLGTAYYAWRGARRDPRTGW
ncbi:hypothetical protein HPO96_28800 [Kribbella sandramycini]|uniref:Uncharacterized protein n=1 Tax=Kribbella sandramycini TaxID=60450 RepID=A0A7Y4P3K4_9ACTN|nr:hypothetical protein [Kribbella sandramycini]MBB6571608.1 hypothetical protein [Kribbella sandramycini]NOL44254.1 hypothetical protein [Kribbella sandramycini]